MQGRPKYNKDYAFMGGSSPDKHQPYLECRCFHEISSGTQPCFDQEAVLCRATLHFRNFTQRGTTEESLNLPLKREHMCDKS